MAVEKTKSTRATKATSAPPAAAAKPATGRKRVTFTVEAPGAKEVFLCGTFNEWNGGTQMKLDGDGTWKATLLLAPGTYEYRIKADDHWMDDPAAESHVPNPYGSRNCVRTV